ncbi:hypothetical protein AGMMS50268_06190 [Spirochaetia bacterium]|nr:hypothetical protein AGMMS50268_06190 [Spirochaetia bacterium]
MGDKNIIENTFGVLEIVNSQWQEKERIEIRYDGRIIHDNFTMRTNLFFLFHSSIVIGNNMWILQVCEHFVILTKSIILALEKIVSEFNKQRMRKTIQHDEYLIWAFYDIFSTMFDFFLSFYDADYNDLDEQNKVDNYTIETKHGNLIDRVNNIKKKYAKLKEEIQRPYIDSLNKLEYEEGIEIKKAYGIYDDPILKIFQDNPNTAESFDNFLQNKEFNSVLDDFFVDMTLETIAYPLKENFNKISETIVKYDFLNDVIMNRQPSIENLLVCRLILDFPEFIDHYSILRNNNIIQVRGSDHVYWNAHDVALVEYFTLIYKGKINSREKKNGDQKEDKLRMPWEILESVFDKRNLKNVHTGKNDSKDFKKIKEILKFPTLRKSLK